MIQDELVQRCRDRLSGLVRWLRATLSKQADEVMLEPRERGASDPWPEAPAWTVPKTGAAWIYLNGSPFLAPGSGPWTVRALLDRMESELDELADSLAASIRLEVARALTDDPELVAAVLARRELVERWPPFQGRTGFEWREGPLQLLLGEALNAKGSPPGMTVTVNAGRVAVEYWTPPDVAPVTLAEWGRERRLLDEGTASAVAKGTMRVPPLVGILWDAIRGAERIRPSPWVDVKLPAGQVAVGALVALNDPRSSWTERVRQDDTRVVLEWSDNRLELPFADGAAGVLVALGKRYGPVVTRDGLVLLALTWAAGVHAGQAAWCWPDEALTLAGVTPSRESRRDWWARLAQLHEVELVVIRGGRTLRAPVLQETAIGGKRGGADPVELKWHPAIYEDICKEDGSPGARWWATPHQLLQLPARDSTHAAALVLGRNLRTAWQHKRTETSIGVELLADYLNLSRKLDRSHQARTAVQMRRILDGLVRVGVLGGWEVEGDLDRLTGTIKYSAGEVGLNGKSVRPPQLVPATGQELQRWLHETGLTAGEAAELLGVRADTVRQWVSRYRSLPLPDSARSVLVAYLRPLPERPRKGP